VWCAHGGVAQGWGRFTSGRFSCHRVEGHHLWPLDRESKQAWLAHIAAELQQLQLP
jgi:hypothetical protein